MPGPTFAFGLAGRLGVGLVVLRGSVQRGYLVGEPILQLGQRVLHSRGGCSLRDAGLVLGEPEQLRDTVLVIA